jgi:ribonucleoside-diphosphate reductase alpha chain
MTKLSDNAIQVAKSRYFMREENWESCTLRVADVVARNEGEYAKYKESFHEMIYNMDFLPGGRILRNAGRPRGSLFNCYHIPIGDSIREIGKCKMDSLLLWSDGGGVGINFSPLRPKGTPIRGMGGDSSGLVSFMKTIDYDAGVIRIGGSRRAAALGSCDISHPEVEEFIDAKIKTGELKNFNISVNITHDFIDAVINDNDWELKFAQKVYKTIKARKLWDKIVSNMIKYGEPGILNWNNIVKNNSYYFNPILGVNPCGEAILGANDLCNLGSIVMSNFIAGTQSTNWIKLEKTLRLAVRFLDNIFDINRYILDEVRLVGQRGRRIGVGVMGVAEYLFAKKIRYGSERSIIELERIMRFMRDTVYDESVNLAIEKGAFPAFDGSAYCKASFIRKLPAKLRMRIRDKGIRNVTLMALAPTGTISLLADVSSGIEPLPAKSYIRKDEVGDRVYIHNLYKEFVKSEEPLPDWYVDTFDLTPEDHFEVQSIFQKYTDGGVSKTIYLPKDVTTKNLKRLLLEYFYDIKGCTIYRDESREGQPINPLKYKDIKKYIKDSESSMTIEDLECKTGNCEI